MVLVLLSACQSKDEQGDMTDLTEFGVRYASAWSSQDPIAFASFYAENASFQINDGDASIGRDAIAETARSFMASFPDMVVRLIELRQTKDHIEFHWHWTGTNTGPGGTGNAVNLRSRRSADQATTGGPQPEATVREVTRVGQYLPLGIRYSRPVLSVDGSLIANWVWEQDERYANGT